MASIVSDEMNESVDLSDEMNESVDLSNLKQKMLARLVLNDDILKHWTINEYLNNSETLDVKSYERHLNSVINLTLSSLDNIGLIDITDGQRGGGVSLKVYIIAVVLAAMYGVLDYGQTHQITLAVKMMDKQFDNISNELETSAPHTSFVLKNIMGKIGTCDYYNPVSTKFESEKIVTNNLLPSNKMELIENKKTIETQLTAFKPVEFEMKSIDLNKVSESLDCQVSNVITAIEADAMLSVRDILQDTEIVDPTIWDKISTGFGLLGNPTATAVDLMNKVEFTGTQSMRRLTIKQQHTSVLISKFKNVIRNIQQIVSTRAMVVTNLGLAKKVIYGISIAGVKAVTGASVDSMSLVVPTDLPNAIITAESAAIVEAIKMISLPLTYAIMDGTKPSEIKDKKGGRKKGRRTKKRKVMKGGLVDIAYVIKNEVEQLKAFEEAFEKAVDINMNSTLQTIKGSGMEGGYWIIDVFNNNGEQGILLGFQEEIDFGDEGRIQYFPPTLGQRGGRKKKKKTRKGKGKKSKKNKTKKGKKRKKKGNNKTKKKRR
jgi:hypothetical protein